MSINPGADPVAPVATAEAYTDAAVADLNAHRWRPSDHGLLAWNMDVGTLSGTNTPAGGVGNYLRVPFSEGGLVSAICYVVATAGVNGGASLANVFFALYNAAGTRLGRTADQSAALTSAGFKSPALVLDGGQSLTIPPGGYVWGGFVVGTQSTTNAVLRAGANSGGFNANLSAASPFRGGTIGTGLTDCPLTITASAMASGSGTWIGLK